MKHISQAIERATSYLSGLDCVAALEQDPKTQDAVVRNISIIGEAAKQLERMAPDFVRGRPEIPWAEMYRIRNKVVHGYFDIDWAIVWDTVRNDLPLLKQNVERLLRDFRSSQSP